MDIGRVKVGTYVVSDPEGTGKVIMDLGGDMYRVRFVSYEMTVRPRHMKPATAEQRTAYEQARAAHAARGQGCAR
ncbi:hypothetical protein SRB5_39170 [Streptomyces sp. RB5]|uniref:Uncharacterized protein n=1 Tax=Streptomyces smaragdinus TaxID=2585196 RepID=A0A7K0CJU4_9ACTN|nr:hypothetical protein [Streptomyces smaragdinus]MQY13765.1 hypothetical protein [Streptomyces smaragdinus]